MNGKFATNSENNTFRLPYMYAAVQLEQFEIDTKEVKLLFVELFTIEAKVCLVYWIVFSFLFL